MHYFANIIASLLFALFLLSFAASKSVAQTDTSNSRDLYLLPDSMADILYGGNLRPKSFILIDSVNQTKFLLDSSRTVITAIDAAGKLLWSADPWKENDGFAWMGVERPRIVIFEFESFEFARIRQKQWISISYNNTQDWIIDKQTCESFMIRQD